MKLASHVALDIVRKLSPAHFLTYLGDQGREMLRERAQGKVEALLFNEVELAVLLHPGADPSIACPQREHYCL